MNVGYLCDFMNHARPLDIKEAELTGDTPFHELELSEFKDTYVIVDEQDRVYAIGGINYGYIKPVVWMLCTIRVEERPVEFLRYAKVLLKNFMSQHTHLWNLVWLGNPVHIKWLEWMGARFYEERQCKDETFRRFEFVKESER